MPPEMPMPTTVCTSRAERLQGKLIFEIFDYSHLEGMANSEFIRSSTFSVGGYGWTIRFYPNGCGLVAKDHISVFLELMDGHSKVMASCDLMLVDQTTGVPISVNKTEQRIFSPSDQSKFAPTIARFMDRSKLEASTYLQDDHLTIQCIVTVLKKSQVLTTKAANEIEVPPSNIREHFGKLLDGEVVGANVTFSVCGENFTAHRIVLAAQSPVFRAELYGPMQEARSELITIEDMQPAVFRALLHFIYTDSLPEVECSIDANLEMIQHLLVAADRYAMDRLKLLCESILCRNVDVDNVSTTLALSYQHNCERLKDICIDVFTRPHVMDALVETAGYKNLKRSCPSVLADVLEKSVRFRKI